MNPAVLPHRLTIVNPGTATDRYGDETPDYVTDATRLEDVPAWVQRIQPRPQDELYESGRDMVGTRWHVFLPIDYVVADALVAVVVSSQSRIEFEDVTFEVIGSPAELVTPRGPDHYEVIIKNVEG